MKSYTDLEQSKTLTKILPTESADMYYMKTSCNSYTIGVLQRMERDMLLNQAEYYKMFPCWSLSALISIIPQELFDGEYIINITEGCDNKWVLTYDHYEDGNPSYYGLSSSADNLVDACVTMIEKLNERKML